MTARVLFIPESTEGFAAETLSELERNIRSRADKH